MNNPVVSSMKTSCLGILAGALVACSSPTSGPDGPPTIGVNVGQIIPNYSFEGYVNPQKGTGPAHQVEMQLYDFKNPTGDGVYPENSVFGEGNPLPRALLINLSAGHCQPCQEEVDKDLPGKYAKFKPLGGEFLLNLAESDVQGEVAGYPTLDKWVMAFNMSFPSVIDPQRQLSALADPSQFPANIIINTRDMMIEEKIAGKPQEDSGFWTIFENIAKP